MAVGNLIMNEHFIKYFVTKEYKSIVDRTYEACGYTLPITSYRFLCFIDRNFRHKFKNWDETRKFCNEVIKLLWKYNEPWCRVSIELLKKYPNIRYPLHHPNECIACKSIFDSIEDYNNHNCVTTNKVERIKPRTFNE